VGSLTNRRKFVALFSLPGHDLGPELFGQARVRIVANRGRAKLQCRRRVAV